MADLRLLENGTDLRLLEDASGRRLIEDGPNVAGGQIPFPGGYGYGSGGYGGGGAGAGGGGLGGGGQGGAGSGGGSGTGTTTTVRLPFKPGLVLFIGTNQTLGGWRTWLDGMNHWTFTGMACWGDADKGSIFNSVHQTRYRSQPWQAHIVGADHGSGQYHGYCIWISETSGLPGGETALAHVTSFHDEGFDLEWDTVAGAGYPIYFVAARDQKSWGDGNITGSVTLDGLTGGDPAQDSRPQGGFSFFHGDNRSGNGAAFGSFLASSVGTWARPDKGDNFDPAASNEHASNNVYEQAFWIPGDSQADYFLDPVGNWHSLVMSSWIAGSLLQGNSALNLTNTQAEHVWQSNEPSGFAWATGARNSCDSRFITPASSGPATHELAYDFTNESSLKPQMGFTYMRPSQDTGISVGHSVGLWARMVENDPSQDFHAIIAVGRDNWTGRTVGYHGLGQSWMGAFSIADPGDVPAGRLEWQEPGEIITHTDQPGSGEHFFMLWMNGVPVGGWIPSFYRWQKY